MTRYHGEMLQYFDEKTIEILNIQLSSGTLILRLKKLEFNSFKLFAMDVVKRGLLPDIMEKESIFSEFYSWLKSTEMFARPSKQIIGKWELIEYYIEIESEVCHINEVQIKAAGEKWEIEFNEDEKYFQQLNLSVPFVSNIENGNWSVAKNFITFLHPKNFRENVEFQLAIEKENLKLLKKDEFGKILFFGFFKKAD